MDDKSFTDMDKNGRITQEPGKTTTTTKLPHSLFSGSPNETPNLLK